MRSAVPFLSLVAAACTSMPSATVPPMQDPDLLVALFDDARSMEQKLAPAFACVSVHEGAAPRDPGPDVIKRLADRWHIPVIPGSRCKVDENSSMVVAPGASGEGKWLRVSKLQCQSQVRCTADVSYYVANLGGGGRGVIADRSGGKWRLTPSGAVWIS